MTTQPADSQGPSEPLTEQDIALWEAALAATTPGEWQCWNGYGPAEDGTYGVLRIGPDDPACRAGLTADTPHADIHGTRADIQFVAFAHNNLAELLAEVRRLRALEALCKSARSCGWGGK